jgi:hypothetical protein
MMRRTRFGLTSIVAAAVLLAGAIPANASHYLGAHWNRVNTAIAQVYYIDHTGAAWPVNSSVVTWNQTSRLGVYYRTPTQGCPGSNVGCVHVYEVNTTEGYYGATIIGPIATGNHFTTVKINLNNHFALSAVGHRHTACQEIGHAFGLDHQYASDTCMNDSRLDTQYPNTHDYDEIRAIYNH